MNGLFGTEYLFKNLYSLLI